MHSNLDWNEKMHPEYVHQHWKGESRKKLQEMSDYISH